MRELRSCGRQNLVLHVQTEFSERMGHRIDCLCPLALGPGCGRGYATQCIGGTNERLDSWKLEPLNDGLPESFRFGTPGLLGKINVDPLGFTAFAFIADAATEAADVERWRE
jgi:hypothetical protein